ncbi:MAG: hypothetical protein AMJ46_03700 [Latescibacteria bacterium DG_63]|nr:MAG: hypothetical protein AMJ46_03700 [Latescibacteria bacterium DG_63]
MLANFRQEGMRQKRVLLILVAVSILGLAFVCGCEKKDLGEMVSNLPPETGIFLEGPLDTLRYAVKLFWWGQDIDGEVIGFYYRWTCADSASLPDTNWVFTTAKSRDFILPVPNGYAVQTFWVKAVDNDSQEDPTPARQDFPLRNAMPSVAFNSGSQPDTTLPAATFSWTGTDLDGNNTIAYYVVWLNGKEDEPLILVGTDTTLGPDYIDSYGNMTVYVRAVDEAQGASAPVSYTWNVIAPVGDVLLIDDVPTSVAGAPTTDAFYRSLLDSLEGSGQYTVFDMGNTSRVKSPREVGLILPLFDQVVWYGDTRSSASGALRMGEQGGGIADFLNAGGKMFLEGIALVGDGGSLTAGFAAQYLGIDSLRTRYISPDNPRSTNFDLLNGWVIRGNSSLGLDSLRTTSILSGCEVVYPSSQAEYVHYLPPGTMSGQTQDYYMGTLVRGGSSSLICVTFPVRRCNGFANARQQVANLLTLLGVGQ